MNEKHSVSQQIYHRLLNLSETKVVNKTPSRADDETELWWERYVGVDINKQG